MRRRVLGWTIVALVVACGRQPAASPPSADVPADGLPDSLTIAAPHAVTIRRVTRDSAARRALEAAERADPPRSAVLASADEAHFTLPEPPAGTRLWWDSAFDGVRIPYAVTDAAVMYYLELSAALRRGDTAQTNGIRMSTSRLEYVATVERHPSYVLHGATYTDVHVVRLRLSWSSYCGSLCAMEFTHDRTVVVDRAGVVRAVRGDGPSAVTVS